MTTPNLKSDFWHKALTVAITIMIVVVGYLATSVHSVSKSNVALSEAFIKMGADVQNHNVNAEKYIEQIEENTERIIALEKGDAVATADRITREEAIENINDAIQGLKEWSDRRYEKK